MKEEVYRVAGRLRLERVRGLQQLDPHPATPRITSMVVDEGPDAADDWIAAHAGPADIVITADIPLARRALAAGAQAVHPTGRVFTLDNIGGALASRAIGEHLRSVGEITGGPKPFASSDRSRFLQSLDAAVVKARR